MMPVRPTTLLNRLRCIFTWLDGHIRHQTRLLPCIEACAYDRLDLFLTFQIFVRNRTKKDFLTPFVDRVLRNPLDTVEALLKDVVWTGNEVSLFPLPQTVNSAGAGTFPIASYCLDRSRVFFAVQGINKISILYCSNFRETHFGL